MEELEATADRPRMMTGAVALARVMERQQDEGPLGRKVRVDEARDEYAPAVAAQRELQERQLAAESSPRQRGRELTLAERVEALEERLAALESASCAA